MAYCTKCGFKVENAKFCPKCGTPQNKNVNANVEKNHNEDFTQVMSKEEFYEKPAEYYEKDNSSNESYMKPVIIGCLIGVFILAVGAISYCFYDKMNNTSVSKSSNVSTTAESTETNKSDADDSENSSSDNSDGKSTTKSSSSKSTNTIKSTNSVNNNAKSGDYIFYNSDSVALSDDQLNSLSAENLALARNEIYARHGYIFQTEPYKSYFNNKTWYKPNAAFKGSDDELNSTERYNVQVLLKHENR